MKKYKFVFISWLNLSTMNFVKAKFFYSYEWRFTVPYRQPAKKSFVNLKSGVLQVILNWKIYLYKKLKQ